MFVDLHVLCLLSVGGLVVLITAVMWGRYNEDYILHTVHTVLMFFINTCVHFFNENRSLNGIMWENVLEPDRKQITIFYV
jgi:hypothetical protein